VGSGSISWYLGQMAQGYEEGRKPILFLPQKPYNVLGSLRQQVMYPSHDKVKPQDDGFTVDMENMHDHLENLDREILSILKAVKLEYLADRLGDGDPRRGLEIVEDWSKVFYCDNYFCALIFCNGC
jgi:ABC-type uncharacterized transport system fused permease/ATPase subunit